jgi:integrase
MNKKEKNQKTKYKGVYLNPTTGKYLVQTTFTTKDGYHIKKCKRGFETAKKADLWKTEQAFHYSQTTYESSNNVRKGMEKLLHEYLAYKKNTCKPTTLTTMELLMKTHVLPFFNKEAKDITAKDIQCFYNSLSNTNLTNTTKNIIVGYVLGFAEWLDIMECITPDMGRKFKRLVVKFDTSYDTKKENVFEEYEVAMMLEALDKNRKCDFKYKVLFSILASTGCRVAEALALKYSDINHSENVITFNKQAQYCLDDDYVKKNLVYDKVGKTYIMNYTKTNTIKKPLVKESVIELIDEYKYYTNSKDDDYIFRTWGNILYSVNVNKRLTSLLDSLNLPHRSAHAFRHYHTTKLYEAGCEPKYVAERLGHTNEQTSLTTYKHLTQKQKEDNDEIIKKLYI